MKRITSTFIAGIACLLLLACGDGGNSGGGGGYGTPPVPIPQDGWKQYSRPSGGYIFTRYAIPAEKRDAVLARIERGLQKCIDITSRHNPTWNRPDHVSGFDTIVFIEPMARNQDGSPALVTRNGIQTAGTVLNVGYPDAVERGNPNIVLPDQGHPDYEWLYLDYLENAVWFECEHVREWLNNKNMFFYFLDAGDVHPHFAE